MIRLLTRLIVVPACSFLFFRRRAGEGALRLSSCCCHDGMIWVMQRHVQHEAVAASIVHYFVLETIVEHHRLAVSTTTTTTTTAAAAAAAAAVRSPLVAHSKPHSVRAFDRKLQHKPSVGGACVRLDSGAWKKEKKKKTWSCIR
jgi:hypothetical protein